MTYRFVFWTDATASGISRSSGQFLQKNPGVLREMPEAVKGLSEAVKGLSEALKGFIHHAASQKNPRHSAGGCVGDGWRQDVSCEGMHVNYSPTSAQHAHWN